MSSEMSQQKNNIPFLREILNVRSVVSLSSRIIPAVRVGVWLLFSFTRRKSTNPDWTVARGANVDAAGNEQIH